MEEALDTSSVGKRAHNRDKLWSLAAPSLHDTLVRAQSTGGNTEAPSHPRPDVSTIHAQARTKRPRGSAGQGHQPLTSPRRIRAVRLPALVRIVLTPPTEGDPDFMKQKPHSD